MIVVKRAVYLMGLAAALNLFVAGSAGAQVKEQRNPGRAFQRMSKYKTYDECLRHNLKLSGSQHRASAWCSRQGYSQ
jgi:hypothetical protein